MDPIPFLDLKSQYREIREHINKAIFNTIDASEFVLGSRVKDFEDQFAAWNGSSFCVGCANGTDALEIALESLGIGWGDEVIVPAMTWISTAEAVVRQGAMPKFVDIDPLTYCIDTHKVEQSITEKTKAVIAVHLYGCPADVSFIRAICDKNNIFLIEDCAQAHGASVDGVKVGNLGHISTFSFFPGKNLGAYGDAGCIVTDSEELALISRQIGNHGQSKKHEHRRIGRNSRLDGIQASILLAKLPFLDEWIARRRALACYYENELTTAHIKKPCFSQHDSHAYHLYVISVDKRRSLQAHLDSLGVATSIHYPSSLPDLAVFRSHVNCSPSEYLHARSLARSCLSIPMSDQLRADQRSRVVEALNSFR
jgi:dTDP-4-amino-4,6-dideoxygalactose transaminase